ncbi:MAG: glutamate--tRNA ligase [Candidatus Latescibacter sp.]|nr:glutamate--tRNA ligase [Candidatus Latescibacter sp.]
MYHPERLRFAPSPTGDLHVGGARAALFNWLYARKTGGKFLLRIEDTDVERSSEKFLESILDSLQWLGLAWDEEPVRQSERGELYRGAVAKLLEEGSAYRCFCTKEELEAERTGNPQELTFQYSGKCRCLSPEEIGRHMKEGRPFTVRFRVSPGQTSFSDLVHGVTTFNNDTIGDFIIARADGSPVYLLGVAVDDADMEITLVMRGDDHISNTPKQIMLMKALGHEIPRFAHLPQVLGPDKKKLSKRHGAASVMEYRNMGFLAPALVNFLALLGWNPGDDREKMSVEELVQAFSIDGIAKKSGVFDIKKLEWLNGLYLNELPAEEILILAMPYFIREGFVPPGGRKKEREYLLKIIHLLKERCRILPDFASQSVYFFREPESYEVKGVEKYFGNREAADFLDTLADRFEARGVFTEKAAEDSVRELAEKLDLNPGKLIHSTRLAVTGVTNGPGLFELLVLVGKERVVARLRRAVHFIRERHITGC